MTTFKGKLLFLAKDSQRVEELGSDRDHDNETYELWVSDREKIELIKPALAITNPSVSNGGGGYFSFIELLAMILLIGMFHPHKRLVKISPSELSIEK